jgi:hypothetical protein
MIFFTSISFDHSAQRSSPPSPHQGQRGRRRCLAGTAIRIIPAASQRQPSGIDVEVVAMQKLSAITGRA